LLLIVTSLTLSPPPPPHCHSLQINAKIRPSTLTKLFSSTLLLSAKTMAEHKPYMVIFKEGTPKSAIEEQKAAVQKAGGTIKQTFDSSIMKGFAATLPDQMAQELTTASVGGKHEHM